jgi:CHAT domain-containing protein/tetratricopeptide (TPR) repeat protein
MRGKQLALAVLLACALAVPVPQAFAAVADDIALLTGQIEYALEDYRPADAETVARKALNLALEEYGAEHLVTANLHRLLGDALYSQDRYADAERHFRPAAAVREKLLGTYHADTAVSINDLAISLRRQERYEEALPLYRKVLDIREKVLGPDHADTARSTFWVATVLQSLERGGEAASVMGTAVERALIALGPTDRFTILWMGQHADLLQDAGDFAAAEPVYIEADKLGKVALDPQDALLSYPLHGLAKLYYRQGRHAEAAPLYRAAIAIREAAYGSEDSDTLASVDGLARALWALGEVEEAEALFRRLLAVRELEDGPDALATADLLRWVGRAASAQGRKAEAEIVFKRVLAISETHLGFDHILTGFDLIALGQLYSGQERFEEARPLLERGVDVLAASPDGGSSVVAALAALSFVERATGNIDRAIELTEQALAETIASKGPRTREVADITFMLGTYRRDAGDLDAGDRLVTNARELYAELAPTSRAYFRITSELGRIRQEQGRTLEALALHRESYAALVSRYGEDSAELRPVLSDLGNALFATSDYETAAANFARAAAIVERLAAVDAATAFAARTGEVEDQVTAAGRVFDALVKSYFRLPGSAEKAFLVAQRATESDAAQALAQMAARQASGSGELAVLVRERQDLVAQWRRDDSALTLALAAADSETVARLRQELQVTDAKISAIDIRLVGGFPAFADLQRPAPLDIATVQSRLGQNDVLLFYADTGRIGDVAAETFLWVVPSGGAAHWFRLPRTTGELSATVRKLRENMGVGAVTRGPKALTPNTATVRADRVLTAAGELYAALLGEAAALIEGRDLIIVPSRSLVSLPFHALVSEIPPMNSRYRDARWLARDHAITILPSVSSLFASSVPILMPANASREPYLVFANPLLTGRSGTDRRAHERVGCAPAPTQIADVEEQPEFAALFRGATADVDAVRQLQPLPETTDEACAIAAALGANDSALHLGAAATEASIKALSHDGTLARTAVIHFATHGLVSGELAGLAEPAIVLTPPDVATAEDDGLLTASEVTTLRFDADWVILSACNTASSDGGGEALSGLARAFFYAGARTLMVSHWPVNSESAVRLASGAVGALAADPSLSRAEALRRAMIAEIERGGEAADPANWAPFIVVGR